MNHVVLIGRLTQDPEMRYTPSGVAVTKFTLAVNRSFKNAEGEREADFIPVVAWRKLAEVCAENIKKGNRVAVQGRVQVRHYENNEGRKIYVTEVVADQVEFLENKRIERTSDAYRIEEDRPIELTEDDLPF